MTESTQFLASDLWDFCAAGWLISMGKAKPETARGERTFAEWVRPLVTPADFQAAIVTMQKLPPAERGRHMTRANRYDGRLTRAAAHA